VGGYPHNRVRLRIELLVPMQRLNGNVVFLNLLGLSREMLLRDIFQEVPEIRRFVQNARLQQGLQFLPLFFLFGTNCLVR
jgi:hypothetical protein